MPPEQEIPAYPLSQDERAAMLRYIASIRKQVQGITELFGTRYGQESSLADLSAKALVFATLLEHELLQVNTLANTDSERSDDFSDAENAIVKTAMQGR